MIPSDTYGCLICAADPRPALLNPLPHPSTSTSTLPEAVYISAPVHTYCLGQAASMGSFLLAAGEKGKRHALTNS
ncbi:hypothetical protein CYLTODRAFT_426665, partial [Cylindrobasidium torrendii FP15055 ss-10]